LRKQLYILLLLVHSIPAQDTFQRESDFELNIRVDPIYFLFGGTLSNIELKYQNNSVLYENVSCCFYLYYTPVESHHIQLRHYFKTSSGEFFISAYHLVTIEKEVEADFLVSGGNIGKKWFRKSKYDLSTRIGFGYPIVQRHQNDYLVWTNDGNGQRQITIHNHKTVNKYDVFTASFDIEVMFGTNILRFFR